MPDLLDVPDLCCKVVLVVRHWNWSQDCCCGWGGFLVGVWAA